MLDGPGSAPHDAPESIGTGGSPGPAPFEPTGHEDVDRVLGAMDGIEQREIHEHVAAFEEAHAALRRALDRADP